VGVWVSRYLKSQFVTPDAFVKVDKIIIAANGLKDLINSLYSGAYVTLTKVDFKALDSLSVRPIGVYGDRSEIIKFLLSLNVINQKL
jgi:hypothetical protein